MLIQCVQNDYAQHCSSVPEREFAFRYNSKAFLMVSFALDMNAVFDSIFQNCAVKYWNNIPRIDQRLWHERYI